MSVRGIRRCRDAHRVAYRARPGVLDLLRRGRVVCTNHTRVFVHVRRQPFTVRRQNSKRCIMADDDTEILTVSLPRAGGEEAPLIFKVEVASEVYSAEGEVSSKLPSFGAVLETVEELGRAFTAVFENVKPKHASVEIGLDIAMEAGQLSALLVKGSAKGAIVVKFDW